MHLRVELVRVPQLREDVTALAADVDDLKRFRWMAGGVAAATGVGGGNLLQFLAR